MKRLIGRTFRVMVGVVAGVVLLVLTTVVPSDAAGYGAASFVNQTYSCYASRSVGFAQIGFLFTVKVSKSYGQAIFTGSGTGPDGNPFNLMGRLEVNADGSGAILDSMEGSNLSWYLPGALNFTVSKGSPAKVQSFSIGGSQTNVFNGDCELQ